MQACTNSATIQRVYVVIAQVIEQLPGLNMCRFHEMRHRDESVDDAVKEPQCETGTVHVDVDPPHELQ